MNLDNQEELSLNLSGVAPGFQVQGTAFNNNCNDTENQIFTHLNCETSVENLRQKNAIALHPNPAKDMLSIITEGNILQIEIYDVQGRLCKRLKQPGADIELNSLSPGLYVFKIETDSGVFTQKIIKESE